MQLALLGGGRMGEALLSGLLDAGWDTDALAVAEVDPERRRLLDERFRGVRVVPSPAWAVAESDVVLVAVKPGDVGLDRNTASTLVHQTLVGAATLLVEGAEGPEALRAAVTSPGGTTAAGLARLEAHGVRAAFLEAVQAATRRSEEIGRPDR